MLKINQQALIENKVHYIRSLYDKHGGMLLGYILEVVKDRKLAEEYLVQLFCELSQQFNEINWDGTNSWSQLRQFAVSRLSVFISAVKDNGQLGGNTDVITGGRTNYLELLTEEQRQVFCGIYYHGKVVAEISKELNKTEDSIRKTLKEAFIIMRKSGEN